MEKVRPVIFKWRQFEPAMIVASVNWYLRYSLSLRDVEELLIELGFSADPPPGLPLVGRLPV